MVGEVEDAIFLLSCRWWKEEEAGLDGAFLKKFETQPHKIFKQATQKLYYDNKLNNTYKII